MTEKLFYQDSHLAEFEASVAGCKYNGTQYEIELDRTVFFPEGGGQYADTGYLGEARISDVQEKDGKIIHYADVEVPEGTVVCGRIDWEERFMKMQQHTGEHIVSGLVHSRYGYDNVGFHLGREDCTMDFNGSLTKEQLREIEQEANRAVWKNLEVETLYPSKEELEKMEYRSKIEIEGQVRIIVIPGYDTCACCAPHVTRTGEIGIIKLTSVQRYKGGVRVTMLCGSRALSDYEKKQEQVASVSALLCAKEYETAEAVEHLKKEYSELKYELNEKEKKLIACRAEQIPAGEDPVCLFPDDLGGDSLRLLMNLVLDKGHSLCAVFHRNDNNTFRYVIGSRSMDVRTFVKEFNAAFHGKGGGKPEMVQGTVSGNENEIEGWILKKAGKC